MFSKLFKSVSSLVDSELRHNLRTNSEYQKYRWNIFERLLAWCWGLRANGTKTYVKEIIRCLYLNLELSVPLLKYPLAT